eukprot:4757294-Pleurochrysis_carterae.AAC.1
MTPTSSGGMPRRVRRSFAARWSLSKTSSNSATPRSSGMEPSATHARRASSTRWKSGEVQRAPPPASACAMPNNSPNTCAPSLLSATAEPSVVCPQWPPRSAPEKELARLSSLFGG